MQALFDRLNGGTLSLIDDHIEAIKLLKLTSQKLISQS